MKLPQERLLYRWHTVRSDGHPESRTYPVVGRPIGEGKTQEPALVGEVMFQKPPKDTEKCWWIGVCAFLVLATLSLASVIIDRLISPFFMEEPLTIFEVLAGLIALLVSAMAVITTTTIALVLACVTLYFIGHKWGWEKPRPV